MSDEHYAYLVESFFGLHPTGYSAIKHEVNGLGSGRARLSTLIWRLEQYAELIPVSGPALRAAAPPTDLPQVYAIRPDDIVMPALPHESATAEGDLSRAYRSALNRAESAMYEERDAAFAAVADRLFPGELADDKVLKGSRYVLLCEISKKKQAVSDAIGTMIEQFRAYRMGDDACLDDVARDFLHSRGLERHVNYIAAETTIVFAETIGDLSRRLGSAIRAVFGAFIAGVTTRTVFLRNAEVVREVLAALTWTDAQSLLEQHRPDTAALEKLKYIDVGPAPEPKRVTEAALTLLAQL